MVEADAGNSCLVGGVTWAVMIIIIDEDGLYSSRIRGIANNNDYWYKSCIIIFEQGKVK